MEPSRAGCFAAALLLCLLLAGGEGCDLPRRLAAPCAAGVASTVAVEDGGVKVGSTIPLEEGVVKVESAIPVEDGDVKVASTIPVKHRGVEAGVAPSLQESRCDNALKLAHAIGKCDVDANTTSTDCCNAVAASVEGKGCLCTVLDQTIRVGSSTTSFEDIVQLYKSCGGARQLNSTTMDCADVENYRTPPPSPTNYSLPSNPVPEPPSGESTHPAAASDNSSTQTATPTPSGDHESKELLHVNEVIMFFVIFIACTLGGIPVTMYYRSKKIKRVEGRRVTIEKTVEAALGARLPPAIQQMEAAIAARAPEIVAQAQAAARLGSSSDLKSRVLALPGSR